MNTEEKIKKLFQDVVESYSGNKKAAANSLGVNTVTFWGWTTGSRGLNKALCEAIDKAGGVLFIPSEEEATPNNSPELLRLKKENAELQKQINTLQAQLAFAEKVLRQPQEKAPVQEASRKEQKFLPLNGTEGGTLD